jgi:hypothetical protein
MTTAPDLPADLDAIQSLVFESTLHSQKCSHLHKPNQLPNYNYCRTQGNVELYIDALIPRFLFMEVIKHGCYGR